MCSWQLSTNPPDPLLHGKSWWHFFKDNLGGVLKDKMKANLIWQWEMWASWVALYVLWHNHHYSRWIRPLNFKTAGNCDKNICLLACPERVFAKEYVIFTQEGEIHLGCWNEQA